MKLSFRLASLWRFVSSIWALFFIITSAAGIFRLPLMQYVEFKGDEALNLFLATRPLFHYGFPPASTASSAGILNFPLLNYLLFPIVIFTTYPPNISFVIALVNTLVIGAFFLLFAKYHDRLTAFFAGAILAVSPWAILYSRKIWAQDFLLPLLFPFFLSVYNIREGKKKYWILYGISSMLLLQIHQIAVLLPVTVTIFLLIYHQKISWRLLILGVMLGLIPALPYVWYQINIFSQSHQISTSLAARFSDRNPILFLRPLQIISIGHFYTEFGDDFALFASKFRAIYLLSKASYLSYVLLPLGVVLWYIKEKIYRFWIMATILSILIMFALGIQSLIHYFIIFLPILALCMGYLLSQLVKSKHISFIGSGLAIVYFCALILFNSGFLLFLSEKKGLAGDYGTGFIESEKVATIALRQYEKNPQYPDMLITYFAPQTWLLGYMPDGQMIYPKKELSKRIATIDQQFIDDPQNPIVSKEIFAYYTQYQNPTWDYVLSIKKRADSYPMYIPVYLTLRDQYLTTHLKHLYESSDFVLLFPQHWKELEDPITSETLFTEDTITLRIKRVTPQATPYNLQDTLSRVSSTSCTDTATWCPLSTPTVKLGRNYYTLTLSSQQTNVSQITQSDAQNIMVDIITSIREK